MHRRSRIASRWNVHHPAEAELGVGDGDVKEGGMAQDYA